MNNRLAELLAEVFGLSAAEIQPGLEKSEIATWDSLKQMDLVVSLEREYGISLDIPDIIEMDSVSRIISVLMKNGVDLGT